jgi:hypothetical protein
VISLSVGQLTPFLYLFISQRLTPFLLILIDHEMALGMNGRFVPEAAGRKNIAHCDHMAKSLADQK